uniref:Cyclin-dependent kinase inhibitor domain-containing protein n=1 Tax=Anopheles atroparvus TaxID=41427 RepID=A0A182JJW0_ANOAO
MGAQVHNRMIQRVHQSPAPPRLKTSMRPALSRVNRVKCNLFGKVDSADLKQYVDDKIKEHNEAKSKKWSFDFQSERPLKNGTFEWQRVVQPVAPLAPTMITLTQAAHVEPTEQRRQSIRRSYSNSSCSSTSSMEALMDERAKRANASRDAVEDELNDSLTSSTSTLSPAVPASPASTEESEPETIDTYPTVRNHKRILREIRRDSAQRTAPASPTNLRQPQITEFMKERKRLTVASVERVSAKKVRRMDDAPSSSSAAGQATDAASTSQQSFA